MEELEENVGRIIPINIETEMKSAYIDYSMSVIVSRALDVRWSETCTQESSVRHVRSRLDQQPICKEIGSYSG